MASKTVKLSEDQTKWGLPGWKPERKFNTDVLIGNWFEERKQFQKIVNPASTTHRVSFQQYPYQRPDLAVRRNAFLANIGLPKNLIFGHHGNAYSNNLISAYDETYNHRERPSEQAFPEKRYWDCKSLSWVPEKSDFPLQGEPTNWGLKAEVEERQIRQLRDEQVSDFTSTYQLNFTEKPIDRARPMYAVPRSKSTGLHKVNLTNRNLMLRNVSFNRPEMPQSLQITNPYIT